LLEGQYFDGTKLKELAALPGKKEMMSAIVGSLHAPISGIVGSINAVMRDLASIIEEVAKKKAS
jgi:large subunit ribosomal protein L10